VVRPGDGEAIWFLNGRMTVKMTGEQSQGAFGLTEAVVPPGFSPPVHVHQREDVSFYVVAGELSVRCGDETHRAPAGSLVFLPRGVPHGFVVSSDTPVRMLNLMTPGGGEGFFVAAGRRAEGDGLPTPAPVDVEQLRRAGEQYGALVVGPPLTASAS
jgi:quercetin dioxygenase-like cupin family protein